MGTPVFEVIFVCNEFYYFFQELELLICGNPVLDTQQLEEGTR